MLAVVLGFGAAACGGFADFAAGVAARRLAPEVVAFWTQGVGVLVGSIFLLLLRPALAPAQLPWGLAAGLMAGVSIALLYRAMALGAISLVVPLAASSVVFPVAFAVATGETLTPLARVGIIAIIGGVALATFHPAPAASHAGGAGGGGRRLAVTLALASAVASGVFLVRIDLAPAGGTCWGPFWTAGAVRVSSFAVQAGLVALGPHPLTSPGRLALPVVAAGALNQIALVLVGSGATTGSYCVVTSLMGLYPVITALLGVVVLGERLTRMQASGAILAMAGVGLVSA